MLMYKPLSPSSESDLSLSFSKIMYFLILYYVRLIYNSSPKKHGVRNASFLKKKQVIFRIVMNLCITSLIVPYEEKRGF